MPERSRRFGGLFGRGNRTAGGAEISRLSVDTEQEASIRLRFLDSSQEIRRRVLVFMLGVAPGDIERRLDVAARGLDPSRDLPVFVVSMLDFAPLRERGVLFEYLPDADAIGASDAEAYTAYVRRRLSILRLKWEPAAEIDVGLSFDVFLAENVAVAAATQDTDVR